MNELYRFIWHEKKDVLIALVCGTLSGVTAVALFAQSGFLISKAALLPPFYIILILTAFLKLFGVVKSASKYGERYISHRVTFRLVSNIRMLFFERLAPIAGQLFTRYRSGDLLARITSDVDVLQSFFLRVVYPPLVALLTFFLTICLTTFFSPWIALLLLIGYVAVGYVLPLYFIQQKGLAHQTKQQVMTELTELLDGYQEFKHHHQHKARRHALLQRAKNYSQLEKKERNAFVKRQTLSQAVALFTAVAVTMTGAYLASIQRLDGLYLAMLILITLTVFEQAIPLATIPQHYNGAKAATERLQAVRNSTQHDVSPLQPAHRYSIFAKALAYQYDSAHRHALKDVNFTIQPYEKIAVVGASGSGKSTLFHLLTKTVLATSGQLLLNTRSLETIQDDSLWQQMSIHSQHNHFFSGTIRQNLLLAKPSALDEELYAALKKAALSTSLDDLVEEKGANLSGGEKQRLAFARVLLKNGAIWLLDEPFTSLDAQTEHTLMQTLLTQATEKTVLLISHKLHILKNMDRVFVMQDGRLIEQGTFEELLLRRGAFYDMYKMEKSRLEGLFE